MWATSRLRDSSYSTGKPCDSPLATSRWSLNPALHGGGTSTNMIWPKGRLVRALKGLARRNPMLLFSFDGSLLLRFEEARLLSLLFQEPPRSPRDEPGFFYAECRTRFLPPSTAARKRQLSACATWPTHEFTLALISAKVPSRLRLCSRFT